MDLRDMLKGDAASRIRDRKTTVVSPWLTLVERAVVDGRGASIGSFHGLLLADYVSVIAVTADGMLPLVRQFRPAIERLTLEFPGGLLDKGEEPEHCALRELSEEVGLQAPHVISLGELLPDSGRLGNRLWGFVAPLAEKQASWTPEPDLEISWVSLATLEDYIRHGTFNHAPHLAMFAVARLRGLI
ncbi:MULTISPECIES: NUDIX hydrolase [Bradyrhizobium]|uniref:NUDIX hydrolase n=1 Tax=Bradyrhizobium TaxID=374 RepID=UPI0012A3261A|nr:MULTISPECIES: NUDIX hydrolase [Bradyrhizobium]BBO04183.1 ADP-ribose pyrophosphatase [Bradyrhizobium ottawaense]GMO46116.1 NUDIX hydrolase [Bradyrhizobium ottawaense]